MRQLENAKFLERQQLHPEPTVIALAKSVPVTDRVAVRASTGPDGAHGSIFRFVGSAERHSPTLGLEPDRQVFDGARVVFEFGRADLTHQLIAVNVHRVIRTAGSRDELPRVILSASFDGHTILPTARPRWSLSTARVPQWPR